MHINIIAANIIRGCRLVTLIHLLAVSHMKRVVLEALRLMRVDLR